MIGRSETDRAVSIAITHVLTIAITTVLISGLLISAGSLLAGETDRSAQRSLDTIGERLSGEISSVERLAADGEAETVRLTVEHPSMVASERYTVTLYNSTDSDVCADDAPLLTGDTNCMHLQTQSGSVDVYVPVTADVDDESSVAGGTITIVYEDDQITLERGT
ncbi:DUF7266 family protein [Natronosalvus vescus]|uniref:DUF7266 family protein n=1 Tax=Natronosalvus vescus TaxID=2953881 RepID=UPI00209039AF|nr:hypothetical protein [Natronosalvus vescus]